MKPEGPIGQRFIRHDVVESTQTLARQALDRGEAEGTVILADVQTQGRGRLGRLWQAPAGSSLLLSILLKPPPVCDRPVVLTLLGAVAVCETIFAAARRQATLKWPNDVLIAGRKVCGVLVERSPRGTVMGLGLNVSTPAAFFEEQGLTGAGSLALFTDQPLDREAVLRDLLDHLNATYADACRGNMADLEARWRFHSALLGRAVKVQTPTQALQGRLLNLSFDHLVLQPPEGGPIRILPEAVLQLGATDAAESSA